MSISHRALIVAIVHKEGCIHSTPPQVPYDSQLLKLTMEELIKWSINPPDVLRYKSSYNQKAPFQ